MELRGQHPPGLKGCPQTQDAIDLSGKESMYSPHPHQPHRGTRPEVEEDMGCQVGFRKLG